MRLAVALLVAGCAVDGPSLEEPAALELELGTLGDQRQFSPLEPGETVAFHQGLQGGHHLYVDARLRSEQLADTVLLTLTLSDAAGVDLANIEHLREPDLLLDSEGWPLLTDLILYLPEPSAVADSDCELTLIVESGKDLGADVASIYLVGAED